MTEHHYTYGSGSFGCLYDNGPNVASNKVDAIDSLLQTFADLSEVELDAMAKELARTGYYRFNNSDAGADYCEIVKQPGPAPEDNDNGS